MAEAVKAFLACIFVIALLLGLLGLLPKPPFDSTDLPPARSGMGLHTDALTGCQYLSRGGLTPRLDAQGRHMCGGTQ